MARAAFGEANNRLVFETAKECVAGMVAAWERQREGGRKEGGRGELRITVMEDIAQVTLAIVAQASFGLSLDAAYGEEREEKEKEEKGGGKKGANKGGGGNGRYTMSFTKCMEIVAQNALAKVGSKERGEGRNRGRKGSGPFCCLRLRRPSLFIGSSSLSSPIHFNFGRVLTLPSLPPFFPQGPHSRLALLLALPLSPQNDQPGLHRVQLSLDRQRRAGAEKERREGARYDEGGRREGGGEGGGGRVATTTTRTRRADPFFPQTQEERRGREGGRQEGRNEEGEGEGGGGHGLSLRGEEGRAGVGARPTPTAESLLAPRPGKR